MLSPSLGAAAPLLAGRLAVLRPAAARHTAPRLTTGSRAVGTEAPGPRVHCRALDGTQAGLEAAVRSLQELRPKQLMLETCGQRRLLAERRAAAGAAGAQAAGASAPGLSHGDAIDVVHGGLRGGDLLALLGEAGELGAQVYAIDRPYQETQNRVARRLVLHPRELRAFARHAAGLLAGGARGSEAPPLEPCPEGVRGILADERERHMAAEVARCAVRGVDVMVICTAEREAGLRRLLDGAAADAAAADGGAAQRGASRVWPFLLVLLYLVLPGYGSMFLAWRASRRLAAALSASTAVALPERVDSATPSTEH